MRVPWQTRSVLAGTAGTAALAGSYAIERRLRPRRQGPLDYDDSIVPGQIVASVMHLGHVTGREDRELGTILRWGYGSAFGLWHGLLREALPRAGADSDLRNDAHERNLLPIPTARSNPAALALARGRDADQPRNTRCVRCCGGHQRRPASPLGDARVGPSSAPPACDWRRC